MIRPQTVGIGFLVLALLGTAAPARPRGKVDLKKWIDGPVRYIARKEEAKAFKALKTDEDRAYFIERFWARRDPTPQTLTNEYRQLFWERVQQANELFLDSPKAGSMTDRGKIYILHGPPDEIQDDIHLTTGEPGRTPGIERWIYEGRPSGRTDVNPVVVVAFHRDAGGEYRITYDPQLTSVFFDAAAIREGRDSGRDLWLGMLAAPARSELSVMLDLGRMQEVPPQAQVLLERVETAEAYQTQPLEARIHRYVASDTREPLAVVTVDVSDTAAGETPAIVARFAPLDAASKPRLLGEDSFRIVESGSARLAQGRLRLDPGRYAVTVLVADPVKVRTGLWRGEIGISGPSEQLRFSDLSWAVELESVSYISLSSYDEPYVIGPFRVVPKLDASFRPGDTVKLFYEIYGASYPLTVRYLLQGREADGSWVDLGQPAEAEQFASSQGWDLLTNERWPLGEYRLRIEAQDSGGRTITTFLPFTLAGEPSS